MRNIDFFELENKLNNIKETTVYGKITAIKGLAIEVTGISDVASIGSKCVIENKDNSKLIAEVISFHHDNAVLMPFGSIEGTSIGAKVKLKETYSVIYPSEKWKGRIIDAHGEAIDEKGILPQGEKAYKIKGAPPISSSRQRVINKIDLGIKSINSFLSCCNGQRMGIFAGSGVGKSVLISMIARFASSDIKVIGLIGERGRELAEFIHEYLGEEGLKNCVIIVSTSDEPAIARRQATYLAMSVAEFFRDQNQEVICILDSVTRFAMAQREIGLAAGEPPTAKGYTPTVFSELAKLLERAGPGMVGSGNITGLFSVLVEGDDMNDPIADAVRGILDGHILLDRSIAEKGIFPAVNILKSVSRTMPQCNNERENEIVSKARKILSTYLNMEEMIKLGIYKRGSDSEIDKAIDIYPSIEEFVKQKIKEKSNFAEGYARLAEIVGI